MGRLLAGVLEADGPVGRTTPKGFRDVAVLDEPWLVALPVGAPTPSSLDDLAGETWLGVDSASAAHEATESALAWFARRPRVAHLYNDSDVAIAMVAGGLGVALLPSLAMMGALRPDGVQAVSLAGLGTRRIVARHRTSRAEPRREVLTVVNEIGAAAAALEPI